MNQTLRIKHWSQSVNIIKEEITKLKRLMYMGLKADVILQKEHGFGVFRALFYTMYKQTPKFCNILNRIYCFLQLNNSLVPSHPWKPKISSGIQKNFRHFIEPEGSLLRSQEPAICPYPKPDQFSPISL
jgi:hypothetical protein